MRDWFFQDPSGSLPAAVHHKVMADERMSLARGAVVLLSKVGTSSTVNG